MPFDEDARAADLLHVEAKIAALERMVGRQALEIEFLKGALTRSRLTQMYGPAVRSKKISTSWR